MVKKGVWHDWDVAEPPPHHSKASTVRERSDETRDTTPGKQKQEH